MRVRPLLSLIAILASAGQLYAASVTFSGSSYSVITITPEKNTGLDDVFVLHDVNGVSMTYAASSQTVKWYRYSNLGGGFAEEIPISKNGNEYRVEKTEGDMGYIVEDGDRKYCFWVVDYSSHPFQLDGISLPATQDCGDTRISVSGTGDAIRYYTINGQQRTLSREIKVTYDTQEWDGEGLSYNRVETIRTFDYLQPEMTVSPAIYCNTSIILSGDRFLTQWGMPQNAEISSFTPNAIEVNTVAEQDTAETDESSNRIPAGITGLGGSAPAEITFRSFNTEAVLHNEWQMADDPEFENITYRITEPDLTYTFTEEGDVYVRYVGSNADGSCEQYGETYTVTIGSSELKCPNAFSPGASEGVNDEWKVSYRSLIEFECWIFDRYGNEIFHFTDPDMGWDGKRKGKLVKPGVYYYVINAVGSDGKHYKESGDINILRYSTFGEPTTETPE